jgi:UDP-N-acetylmuramoylalanine-D-glutamate ligase
VSVLVEGFGADAIAVASFLAREGRQVLLAGPGDPSPEASSLRELGIEVAADTDLDHRVPGVEVAYLDVWTPAVAPRVARLLAAGTRISNIGDLVLERSRGRVVGVTGTAGKTTTAGLLAHLLRAGGSSVVVSDRSANANLWPSGDLLGRVDAAGPETTVLVELTSSHLAFMCRSPDCAVVTNFWPDHLELHGSLAAYRHAKETIVRHQRDGDLVVVDLGDPDVAAFAALTPAACVGFAGCERGDARAWIDRDEVVLAVDGGLVRARLPAASVFRGRRAVNVAAACAAARALGCDAGVIAEALSGAEPPRYRSRSVGRVGSCPVVDDGMAATPAKVRAALDDHAPGSVVLLAGGDASPATGPVHASEVEEEGIESACDAVARAARVAVLFGSAAPRLDARLRRRGVRVLLSDGFADAVATATSMLGKGDALLFAPMFPIAQLERERFASLVPGLVPTMSDR